MATLAVFLAARLERMDQRGHQLGTRSAERVAQCDRAAIDVEFVGIGPEMLEPGERYRREGLVDLIQVDVADVHARALERTIGGEQRFFERDHRIPGRDGQIVDPRQRGEAVVLRG